MEDVLTLILGGGRGARLDPLTRRRSEPAVPVAGKYRLIDVPISNCINSGLRRIYVLTQYLSVSLHRHIGNTYQFDPFSRGFVEVLAAQQTNEGGDWYQGTADAVRQHLRYVAEDPGRDVLILCGDQLYRFDFRPLVQAHRARDADVTIGVLPVAAAAAGNYGVARLDDERRVAAMVEKPQTPEQLAALRTPPEWLQRQGFEAHGREHLANMGFYLFKSEALVELLQELPLATNLVTDLLARAIGKRPVLGHIYDGYWQDVGSIRSYYEAHLALTGDDPFDFNVAEGVIYTRMRYLPASRVLASRIEQCLICDGCRVETGAHLERCVLGVRSRVGPGVHMRDVVMMGANYFEEDAANRPDGTAGQPALGVGDGSVLEGVILDKNCRIGRNVRIVNHGHAANEEGSNYVIREGIVVIPHGTTVPDGTVI